MSPVNVGAIGAYIREQREQAKISLRQLAQSAGISNPYLSQIERGLRRPSADILQQIAKGLRISAEALYVQAGFLEDRPPGSVVREAVLTDQELTERQKQMLIEIYESFRKETLMSGAGTVGLVDDQSGLDPDEAALTWPDDRRPAALTGRPRLALAAPSGNDDTDDTDEGDDPRDAWSWSPGEDDDPAGDPLAAVTQGPWAVPGNSAAEPDAGAETADAGAETDAEADQAVTWAGTSPTETVGGDETEQTHEFPPGPGSG
jgi:transcriptional regulator with XRE-family HTH domain